MNIFMIGGTGFISSCLTRRLQAAGHTITLFTRGKKPVPFIGVETVRGDRRNPADLRNAAGSRTFDVVIDMVAYDPADSQTAADVFSGRIGRFVQMSTVSVYMVSAGVRCPVTEDQDKLPLMPFWDRNPFGMEYGINKRKCEDILWKAHDLRKFPVTMLRPTFVSGPHDPSMRDWFWIERILDGKPLLVPGTGDIPFQLVYSDDVAKVFLDILDQPASVGKVYNVASEEIYTIDRYLNLLGGLLGLTPEIVHIDQEMFQELPFSTHARGDVFPYNVQRPSVFSVNSIKHDLGFISTPFTTWMEMTIEWFRTSGKHSFGYERREEEITYMQQNRK